MTTSMLETTSIDTLRQILEKEQGRCVDFNEAAVIGEYLVSFYEILSQNDLDTDLRVYQGTKPGDYDKQ